MSAEEDFIEQKNQVKLNDARIKAIINLLSTEGVITPEEVDTEVARILGQKEND